MFFVICEGAIYNPNNHEAEIAFRYAIYQENMYNPRIEFVPVVRIVDPSDSFQAEKIVCKLAAEGVVGIFGVTSIETTG